MQALLRLLGPLAPWGRQLVRLLISLLVLLPFYWHISGDLRLDLIDRVENFLYDARIQLTMPDTVDERIVIVDIDDLSLTREGWWPWTRDKIAAMVNTLFDDYGVAVLAFDVLFAEPEDPTASRIIEEFEAAYAGDDTAFRELLANRGATLNRDELFSESLIARDVILGMVFKPYLQEGEPPAIGVLPRPLIRQRDIAGWEVPFKTAVGFIGSLKLLQQNALTSGFFDNPLIDNDGVYRRVPLVQAYAGDLYESLALATARTVLGQPAVQFQFDPASTGARTGLTLERLMVGDRAVPVDEHVAVLVPYRGHQGSFRYISATRVLNGEADPDVLRDAIVFIGTTAPGLMDLRSTPVARTYAGVEIHANIVAGILDGTIRYQPPYTAAIELTGLILIGLLLALLLPTLSPLSGLLLVALVFAGTIGINLAFWIQASLVIPLASLLVYCVLTALLQTNYGYFVESRKKRRLSRLFGHYVPPELVDEMDRSLTSISLDGESRVMSVLFTDVRGFTTISEGLSPQELKQLMNEFLTPVTRVIHQHRGTIDKYMGDAVMAFWGAPLSDEAHAKNALRAGLTLIATVNELGDKFERRGWPRLKIGVGISTGEMNVGNMGSEFRMAYTVLGDIVNLGSRLEGLTKQYGVDIMVSGATAEAVPEYLYRQLDRVRVKGKDEPVAIFEPLGLASSATREMRAELKLYHGMLEEYRQGHWDKAEEGFRRLQAITPRRVNAVYLERITRCRKHPPAPDWDGVFTYDFK